MLVKAANPAIDDSCFLFLAEQSGVYFFMGVKVCLVGAV
jgi:hypothetical protein